MTVQVTMQADYWIGQIKAADTALRTAEERLQFVAKTLLAFHDNKAWLITGHTSFQDAWTNITGRSGTTANRLLQVAKVGSDLEEILGEVVWENMPGTHAKHLIKLDTPEKKAEALTRAQETAASEGQALTESHIKQAVQQTLAKETWQGQYKVIDRLVATNQLAANDASDVVAALNVVGKHGSPILLDLFTKWGCPADPDLIATMGKDAAKFGRKDESDSFRMVWDSGEIIDVPLKRANIQNYLDLKRWSRQQHMLTGSEIPVNLYPYDPVKTAKMIVRALPDPQDVMNLSIALHEIISMEYQAHPPTLQNHPQTDESQIYQ